MGIDIIIHIAGCIIFQKPTEKADALPAESFVARATMQQNTGKSLFLSRCL